MPTTRVVPRIRIGSACKSRLNRLSFHACRRASFSPVELLFDLVQREPSRLRLMYGVNALGRRQGLRERNLRRFHAPRVSVPGTAIGGEFLGRISYQEAVKSLQSGMQR